MTRAERDALRALEFRPRIVVEREQLLALLDAADDRDAMKDEMRRDDGSFARAVTKLNALRAVAEQAREALKETERLLSKAHDAMYGLPDGGSREGSEYPTREERTEASWQLHYAHAVTRPALAALDTVLEPKAENHE